MKREKKKKLDFNESPDVAIGDLLGLSRQSRPAETHKERPKETKAEGRAKKNSRVVLRRERKGRKGKTVTLVEGLSRSGRELEDLARRMRRDLGCGSHVEEAVVVLQGDQMERVFLWLEREGVSRIVKGS